MNAKVGQQASGSWSSGRCLRYSRRDGKPRS
jgi:hypothetical protein